MTNFCAFKTLFIKINTILFMDYYQHKIKKETSYYGGYHRNYRVYEREFNKSKVEGIGKK
jgi:hypothetical protein